MIKFLIRLLGAMPGLGAVPWLPIVAALAIGGTVLAYGHHQKQKGFEAGEKVGFAQGEKKGLAIGHVNGMAEEANRQAEETGKLNSELQKLRQAQMGQAVRDAAIRQQAYELARAEIDKEAASKVQSCFPTSSEAAAINKVR